MVLAAGGRRAGLVVGQILDIVDEATVGRTEGGRPGVRFSAVVQGRVTEFLDVEAILQADDTAARPLPAAAATGG